MIIICRLKLCSIYNFFLIINFFKPIYVLGGAAIANHICFIISDDYDSTRVRWTDKKKSSIYFNEICVVGREIDAGFV